MTLHLNYLSALFLVAPKMAKYKPMTRAELIANLALKYPQLTVSDVNLAVKSLLDSLTNHLAIGNRVEIRGFGVFSVHVRQPRLGRNPKTGVSVAVPEKNVVHFKAGVEMRERVNVRSPFSQ